MARCDSCKAPIRWAISVTTGKRMPIDLDPVAGGNISLDAGADGELVATVVPAAAGEMRHVSHFATCPNAKAHRRARSA